MVGVLFYRVKGQNLLKMVIPVVHFFSRVAAWASNLLNIELYRHTFSKLTL